MKILVVEHDKELAAALTSTLGAHAYTVDQLGGGIEAERRLVLNHTMYDVILIDLELPDGSAFDICERLRDERIHTPILAIAARGDVAGRVDVLRLGADDCVTKPFSAAELKARILALLRRQPYFIPNELTVGDILLDLRTRRAFKDEEEIPLSHKEFGILEYLMRHPNQVVERDQILDHAWEFEFSSLSNVVDVHVHALRKKAGLNRSLETVRGVGYRLNV